MPYAELTSCPLFHAFCPFESFINSQLSALFLLPTGDCQLQTADCPMLYALCSLIVARLYIYRNERQDDQNTAG
jgi:hypothetical protein